MRPAFFTAEGRANSPVPRFPFIKWIKVSSSLAEEKRKMFSCLDVKLQVQTGTGTNNSVFVVDSEERGRERRTGQGMRGEERGGEGRRGML